MSDRICLITGASRGIGRATAVLAAQQGYQVCVNYLSNQQAADEVVAEIKQAGGDAFAVQADVAEEAEVLRLFEAIDSTHGTLAVLINNAGITHQLMPIAEMDYPTIDKLFKLNIGSYFLCAREAINRLSVQKGGQGGNIINISSIAARLGSANDYVDYAASKGAIDTMTKGLAKELAKDKIRVNAVRPGIIKTDIHELSGVPDRVKSREHLIPMQRAGKPIEVAYAIMWLASTQASYVTGSILDVSGGL